MASWLTLLAAGLVVGCRCSSEPESAGAVAAPAAPVDDCVRSSVQLTLAPSEGAPARQDSLEPSAELPFATEPGMALALAGSFFATGQRHEPRGAMALLGRVGDESTPAQLVELGRLRGEVSPPRLASDGTDLWVVLQDGTAGGHSLRVGRFAGGDLSLPPIWQAGPEQTNAESNGFDIAAQPGAALLVYDDWSASANHGQIRAASLTRAPPAGEPVEAHIEGKVMTLAGVDAEAPRASVRPGGFWLAWLVNASAGGTGRVYDPGLETDERAVPGSAYGARWLSIAALDDQGKMLGEIRRLTGRRERVVGYDLTTGPDGSAWLTWRQDAPTPGASGGRIFMAEVPSNGSHQLRPIREDDVGAGEPTWLPAEADAARWLTFPDARDRTVLLRVSSYDQLGTPLRLGTELEGAGALAAFGDRILFALPRGRAIELLPATCAARSTRVSAFDAGAGGILPALPDDAGSPAPGAGPP
jgi:hypothetical protein